MHARADESIRVLIADDHQLVRRGTREILEESGRFTIVAEAETGPEAVSLTKEWGPDVVLLDIGMPGMNGVDVTRAIKRSRPRSSVLVLSVHSDIEYVWGAIRAGASGYILKDIDDAALADAVVRVHEGGAVLHPDLTEAVLARVRLEAARDDAPEVDLSVRERETLGWAARGLPNAAIAQRLGVSSRTVEAHLARIYKKLQVHNRTEAVIAGMRLGLVSTEDTDT